MADSPPRSDTGFTGFDIDLGQQLSRQMGLELSVQDVGFETLRAGRCSRPDSATRAPAPRPSRPSARRMDDGVIMEEGVPGEVLANPQNARTQEFLSKVR